MRPGATLVGDMGTNDPGQFVPIGAGVRPALTFPKKSKKPLSRKEVFEILLIGETPSNKSGDPVFFAIQ